MTFSGVLTDINSALDGLLFDADLDFVGLASLRTIVTDNANTGLGGALADDQTVFINVGP